MEVSKILQKKSKKILESEIFPKLTNYRKRKI